MVLQRFIKFIAEKAEQGSADHERELQNAADQHPEITDDVIAAYIEVSAPVAADDWPILPQEYTESEPEVATVTVEQSSEKWCSYHKRMEPTSAFNTHRTSRDGLQSYCKDALSEYHKNKAKRNRANATTMVDVLVNNHPAIKSPKRVRKIYPSTAPMDAMAPDGYLWCSHCGTYKRDEQFAVDSSKYRSARRQRRTYCLSCSAKEYN